MASSDFTRRVYQITRQIPKGRVATYGQLAALVGRPRSARAVGMAMKTNPNAPRVPCHRVVAANGALTGYSAFRGLVTKKAMLIREGVVFKGDKVDLTQCQWQPLHTR